MSPRMRTVGALAVAVVLFVGGASPAFAQSCGSSDECYDICREAGELAASVPYPEPDGSNCFSSTLIRRAWPACETLQQIGDNQNALDTANWALVQIQDYNDNKCKAQ